MGCCVEAHCWTLDQSMHSRKARQYQQKHSPAHTYHRHQSSLIFFFHLLWSMASSLSPCSIYVPHSLFPQSLSQVFFGLPLGLAPSTSYSIQMRCLWNCGSEGLLLSTVWKWALALLTGSWLYFQQTIYCIFSDISQWNTPSALPCQLLHKKIYFTSSTALLPSLPQFQRHLICMEYEVEGARLEVDQRKLGRETVEKDCQAPVVDVSLNKHAKSHTSPEIFQSNFLVVLDELSDYHQIYSDGSKMLLQQLWVVRKWRAYGFWTMPAFLPVNILLLISHLI